MSLHKENESIPLMDETINHWMIKSQASGSTPESLYEDAKQYFMWCEANPIKVPQIVVQTGAQTMVHKTRPYNLPALCVHCGVTVGYINDMSRKPAAQEWYQVAQWILAVIYSQNLEYSMVGVFNANITKAKLGLGNREDEIKAPAVIEMKVVNSADVPSLAENEIEETTK